MNIKTKLLPLLIATATLAAAGCDTASESPFSPGGGGSSGLPISNKNFNIFMDPVDPDVIDDDGGHGGVEVSLVIEAGDKFNSSVSGGTVHFYTEWGILDDSSCEIIQGTCSVTWRSDSNFSFLPPDLRTVIVAYTYGEESYVDLNGSGTFDDADGNSFLRDIEEPYLDLDRSFTYTPADQIIDTDFSGAHTPADGMFNGAGCAHSTLCGTPSRIVIWDVAYLNLDQRTVTGTAPTALITAPANSATISGTVNFAVTAEDAEDGTIIGTDDPVAGNSILWYSSIEGYIGSGNSINVDVSGWTTGAHIISVYVTDSEGNTTTDVSSVIR